ncbi:cyanophycin synthetase [Bordetella genomosp. 5]|uniref:cyanophycin synthetase n=1 Tax=Bordetella genomosp. 5 TaxID=1395608 RepID=UPI000B9DD4C6|nr:cyanophycin synthetase [Bordetella genomosp. 5]OZI42254.1 cyanophycin synthetase [Bordetella genomosp. 5]
MEVSRIRALRGPNLWSRNTAIEAIASCADQECSLASLPDLEARLRARFPQLGLLQPEGHADSVSLAHVLQIIALSLQAHAGCPVTFGRTSPTIEPGVFQVVVEYSEEEVGRLAMTLAVELIESAQADTPFDLPDALRRLRELDEDVRLGPSTGSIVNAATARNIPYHRLTQGSMVQFGWGRRQRRIQAAETDRTSAISESIAQDKDLTKMLLDAAGVPVPLGRSVDSAEAAWEAAQELGGPVVVKPRDGSQGRGVAVNIETRERVLAAFEAASDISSEVIVERYIPGHDFRLLVVGNTLVAAARRDPPQVTGDGVQTIRQLVEQVNADPLRGDGHATSLTKIRFDDIALATLRKQGYEADSVPPAGTLVVLRNNANLSTGGSATDVTDEVHPEMAARAVTAARMIGLDICGVDVVAETVHLPLEDQHGGVVEVNAAPGLRMHLNPSFGKGRAVGEAIVGQMFADGDDARIPVIAVAGTNGKTTTVRLSAHLLTCAGNNVGMTNSDGVYVGKRRIDTGDCSGPRSARRILLHPEVDAAVFETARGGILREGLAFDRCDVAIVTNIGMGDHLGLGYISTVEDLAVVKRVIVQYVKNSGMAVLNAGDHIVAEMASACPGEVTYFALDRNHPLIATHRAQGKRVVYRDGDHIVAAQGTQEVTLPLAAIPLTRDGAITFQVENAMACVGAAWALGLDWQVVRDGLASFVNDAATAPGRFNVFDYRGATLIADYGHNPDAILALVQAVQAMPAKRLSVVISGAGDRRDEDLSRQTEILGDVFDDVILYEDQCQRGRADGEVLALLRQGLANAQRANHVEEIRGEFIAIDRALERLNPGDLCLILVDQVEEALAHIAERVAGR